ncbi:unnamed protein product, partial [Mesorhabditis belari]|uniref:Uncharacterized protein n=1 Tax=Mesorhabditis belari TaxID=2138241 RepID=A0AAF3FRM2_9BILA
MPASQSPGCSTTNDDSNRNIETPNTGQAQQNLQNPEQIKKDKKRRKMIFGTIIGCWIAVYSVDVMGRHSLNNTEIFSGKCNWAPGLGTFTLIVVIINDYSEFLEAFSPMYLCFTVCMLD